MWHGGKVSKVTNRRKLLLNDLLRSSLSMNLSHFGTIIFELYRNEANGHLVLARSLVLGLHDWKHLPANRI